MTGTLKWFDAGKGYGFIAPTTGGRDVFVHISEAQLAGIDELRTGDALVFDVTTRDDGRSCATNLRRAAFHRADVL